jgi:hypothetical protein
MGEKRKNPTSPTLSTIPHCCLPPRHTAPRRLPQRRLPPPRYTATSFFRIDNTKQHPQTLQIAIPTTTTTIFR